MNNPFKIFDQKIERKLDKERLGLPHPSMFSLFRLENHAYERIRASWQEARDALELESSFLQRLENAVDFNAEYFTIFDEELYEDDSRPFRSLDLGIASAVLTLAAMGCVTVASCNGGFLGDSHHEDYPLIVFYAQAKDAQLLLKTAELSGIGISNDDGPVTVWANDIWQMHRFASEIIKSRNRKSKG